MRSIITGFFIVILLSSVSVPGLIQNNYFLNQVMAQSSVDDVSDIGSYVVLGLEEVEIKKDTTIHSGNIGVNDIDSEIKLEKNVLMNEPDSFVAGDTIKIEKNSIVQNVFFNELENKGSIVGVETSPLSLPLITEFPNISNLPSGTTSVDVQKDDSQTIPSGQYDEIFVDEGAALVFEGGIYSATSIEAKKGAKILFDDATEITIKDELKLDKETSFGPSQSSDIGASDVIIFVGDVSNPDNETNVDFDKDSLISANIFAPYGEIKMDKGITATGSFIANKVKIEKDSNLTLDSAFEVSLVILRDIAKLSTDLEVSNGVFDEAIIVDATFQKTTELKDTVNLLVIDDTIKQNLLSILDDALSSLSDAGSFVLSLDEAGANNKISDMQDTLSIFKSEVELERGVGISDLIADSLVNDVDTIIDDSNQNGLDIAALDVDEASSFVLVPLLQTIEANFDEVATLLEELESLGIPIEFVVEEGSPLDGFIRGFIKGSSITILELSATPLCGLVTSGAIVHLANVKNIPVTFNQSWKLVTLHNDFCTQLADHTFQTNDDVLTEQTTQYLTAVLSSIPFRSSDTVKQNIVDTLNLPLVREFWTFDFFNSKVDPVFGTPAGINNEEALLLAQQIVSGQISGFVFLDIDNDQIYNPSLGDEPIPQATLVIDNDLDPRPATSTVSGSNGEYIFPNLSTGTHTITLEPIDGLIQTVPVGSHSVPISFGIIVSGKDFGHQQIVTTPSTATEIAQLSDTGVAITTNDQFGSSISIEGNTAIVGAPNFDSPFLPFQSGAVYVFTKIGNTWIEQDRIENPDPETNDGFGHSVSLSGETALIGTRNGDKAYVFVRNNDAWAQQAKFENPITGNFNFFGQSVALLGDTAVIGDPSYPAADVRSGAVYILTRSGTTWTQQAQLTTSDAAAHDRFGHSVSISGDTVIAGTFFADSSANRLGSVYVFERSGTTWTQQAKLSASDEAEFDFFGSALSISGDTVMIGSPRDDDAGSSSGSVYVFERSGTAWTEQIKLTSSDAAAGDFFGRFVFHLGDTAIIGSPGQDVNSVIRAGSAYLFTNNGNTWTEQTRITASDPAMDDFFGGAFSFSDDTAIIGAQLKDTPGKGTNSGDAYVFELQ